MIAGAPVRTIQEGAASATYGDGIAVLPGMYQGPVHPGRYPSLCDGILHQHQDRLIGRVGLCCPLRRR